MGIGRINGKEIIIKFPPNGLGRVEFKADVQTGDGLSLGEVRFKLDSGSDFTTINREDLESLGYTQEFLKTCPFHHSDVLAASDDVKMRLQYITNISIKFGYRELKGCRIFFNLGKNLRSLFGSDILKYFNYEINYDKSEFRLNKTKIPPILSESETLIQIYTVERE